MSQVKNIEKTLTNNEIFQINNQHFTHRLSSTNEAYTNQHLNAACSECKKPKIYNPKSDWYKLGIITIDQKPSCLCTNTNKKNNTYYVCGICLVKDNSMMYNKQFTDKAKLKVHLKRAKGHIEYNQFIVEEYRKSNITTTNNNISNAANDDNAMNINNNNNNNNTIVDNMNNDDNFNSSFDNNNIDNLMETPTNCVMLSKGDTMTNDDDNPDEAISKSVAIQDRRLPFTSF